MAYKYRSDFVYLSSRIARNLIGKMCFGNYSIARDYWSSAVQPRLAFLDNVLEPQRALLNSSNDTRRVVDEELAALDAAASHIRFRRNSMTPICRIPPEILAAIFELYVSRFRIERASKAGYGQGKKPSKTFKHSGIAWVMPLTHVCRHWRSVALGSPTLWQTVDLDTGVQWWKEMIVRSNPAPLTLVASDHQKCSRRFDGCTPARYKCVLNQIHATRTLPTHLHRIREIDLYGCSDNVIQLVSSLTTPAPTLQALNIAVHDRPNTFIESEEEGYTMLPDTLFSGSTSELRKISLQECSLSWTSPLLKNLTHLKIVSIFQNPLAHAGSFINFLNAIEAMPALETLDLSEVLPIDSGSIAVNRPIISLRTLTKLSLSDSAGACAALLAHLETPSCIDFTIDCTSTDDTGVHCDAILPFLSTVNLRVQASGKVIRSLEVEHGNSRLMVAAYEDDLKQDMRPHPGDPVVKIYFSDWAMPESSGESANVMEKTLESFPRHTLTNLSFKGSDFSREKRVQMFGCATQISYVYAVDAAGETLVSALGSSLSRVDSQHTPNAEDIDRRIFPHLKTLALQYVELDQVVTRDDDELGTILSRYLGDCLDAMVKLIVRKSELSEATEKSLSRVAVLDWDHYVKPSTLAHLWENSDEGANLEGGEVSEDMDVSNGGLEENEGREETDAS